MCHKIKTFTVSTSDAKKKGVTHYTASEVFPESPNTHLHVRLISFSRWCISMLPLFH